jgi:hypothetical protein
VHANVTATADLLILAGGPSNASMLVSHPNWNSNSAILIRDTGERFSGISLENLRV